MKGQLKIYITAEKVEKAVKKLKSGKGAEPAEVAAEQLKNLDEEGREVLRDILRRMVQEDQTPEWTRSYIVPIYKEERNPMEGKDYRAI